MTTVFITALLLWLVYQLLLGLLIGWAAGRLARQAAGWLATSLQAARESREGDEAAQLEAEEHYRRQDFQLRRELGCSFATLAHYAPW